MQRQHPHPRALNVVVQPGKVDGIEASGGDKMGEAQVRKIADRPSVVKDRENEIAVAARGERATGAVKGAAGGFGGLPSVQP